MSDLKPTPVKLMAGKPFDDAVNSRGRKFAAGDAALLLQNLKAARSILRVVALAARAQFDGSVMYEDNNVGRWLPAVDEARVRLAAVRDVLIETHSAPALDWFTSLVLVEAIGAALWCDNTCAQSEKLEEVELESAAQVAIESLDSLFEDCVTHGVLAMANAAGAASVH